MSRSRAKLSGRGRWGVAILAMALLALAGLSTVPFLVRQALQPQIDESHQMLALIEAKLKAAGSHIKTPLVAAADAPLAFVEGRTAGLATAALQRIAVDKAAAAGLQVERVQPLPAEEKDGVATLRLQIDMTGSLTAIRDFLVALEGNAPMLFVKEAHLSPPAGLDPQDTAAHPADLLSAAFTIEGYSWWGAAP